jgi:SulP family sulfate permease
VFFPTLRGYRFAWAGADLAAGALLAALAIPTQIATARLGGMAPEAGLLAFIAARLAVAVFAQNRFLSVGADSTIAPIFAVTVAGFAAVGSHAYVAYVGLVAFLVGIMLLAAGTFHAEWISDLLSIPVTIGFLAGIAVQITVSQLPALLGVPSTRTAVVPRLIQIAHALPHANPLAFALGFGVLAITLGARLLSAKIPGALVAFVVVGFVVGILHLQSRVAVLGPLHAMLPHFALPLPQDVRLGQVLPLAVVVAVVCTMQTVTTLRTFRSAKGIVETSRELAATGAGSILTSLFGSFAVDASPPLTAVMKEAGAASQAAGLVAAGGVVLFVALGSHLTEYVPESALAGILIFLAMEIFQVREIRRIARENRPELVLVVVAALLVILLRINVGMMLSILLSLLYGVYGMLRPPSTELVHVPNTTIWWPPLRGERGEREAGVVVFAPATPLYFMNVRYVCERLHAAVDAAGDVRVVVIEGSGVIDIDYTGAHVFKSALRTLRDRGIALGIARLSDERAIAAAQRTGIVDVVGEAHMFKSADEAVHGLS